jgi:hypothetical protein
MHKHHLIHLDVEVVRLPTRHIWHMSGYGQAGPEGNAKSQCSMTKIDRKAIFV